LFGRLAWKYASIFLKAKHLYYALYRQFHAERMGYIDEMVLLCSEGAAEVVVLADRL
jgi:hypothetical protein